MYLIAYLGCGKGSSHKNHCMHATYCFGKEFIHSRNLFYVVNNRLLESAGQGAEKFDGFLDFLFDLLVFQSLVIGDIIRKLSVEGKCHMTSHLRVMKNSTQEYTRHIHRDNKAHIQR